jgi:hypothetical protein
VTAVVIVRRKLRINANFIFLFILQPKFNDMEVCIF